MNGPDVPLPLILTDAEPVEPTPDVERAIEEGREAIANGQLVFFGSDEEFEAHLNKIAQDGSRGSVVGPSPDETRPGVEPGRSE